MKPIIKGPLSAFVTPAAGIITVIVLGVIFSAIITGSGLGIDGDGYYYINAARVIASHLGTGALAAMDKDLLREITAYHVYLMELWPIFYPALLAAVSFSADPYIAGRWLHLAFPVMIGILLWLIVYHNRRAHLPALLAIALILFSPQILLLNCFVFSETPFLILQLSSLLAVSYYLHTGRKTWLVVAIVFIALAGMTRYIGVVMALALGIVLWRANPGAATFKRLISSVACVAFCVLPVIVYMFSSIVYGQTLFVAGRSLAWDWPLVKALMFFEKSIRSPLQYLSPAGLSGEMQFAFAIPAAIIIFVLFVYRFKQQRQHPPAAHVLQLQGYIKLCLVIYLVMASGLALFLDHMLCFTGITTRHFAPLYVWLVVLMALTGASGRRLNREPVNHVMPRFSGAVAVIIISIFFIGSIITVYKNRDMAAGTQKVWADSTVLEYTRKTDHTQWLVSNMAGEMFHYLKKPVFALPSHYDFFKAQANPYYRQQMSDLKRLLHQHDGLVLYFNPYRHLPREVADQATRPEECLNLLNLEVLFQDKTGMIMRPRQGK